MQNQYLIVAENITFKNNKLSCINIYDQFVAVTLPAELNFDMVVICGPGWEPGNYSLGVKVKIDEAEPQEIGNVNVEIISDNFIYNALAPNLKISVEENIKNITFLVFRDDEIIIERTFLVNSILVPKKQET